MPKKITLHQSKAKQFNCKNKIQLRSKTILGLNHLLLIFTGTTMPSIRSYNQPIFSENLFCDKIPNTYKTVYDHLLYHFLQFFPCMLHSCQCYVHSENLVCALWKMKFQFSSNQHQIFIPVSLYFLLKRLVKRYRCCRTFIRVIETRAAEGDMEKNC